jgi:hypothetical protein
LAKRPRRVLVEFVLERRGSEEFETARSIEFIFKRKILFFLPLRLLFVVVLVDELGHQLFQQLLGEVAGGRGDEIALVPALLWFDGEGQGRGAAVAISAIGERKKEKKGSEKSSTDLTGSAVVRSGPKTSRFTPAGEGA